MVVSGSAICIIGFSGVVLMIVTPKLKRGAQKINRYVKSVKKKIDIRNSLNRQRL